MSLQWVILAGLIAAAWGVLGVVVGQWLRTWPLWAPILTVAGFGVMVAAGAALWLQDRTGMDAEAALALVVLAWCAVTFGGVGLFVAAGALAQRVSDRRRRERERR